MDNFSIFCNAVSNEILYTFYKIKMVFWIGDIMMKSLMIGIILSVKSEEKDSNNEG